MAIACRSLPKSLLVDIEKHVAFVRGITMRFLLSIDQFHLQRSEKDVTKDMSKI